MESTIDKAGRLVIPKEIREQADLRPGAPLRIRFIHGHIEIEPAVAEPELAMENDRPVLQHANAADARLTPETVTALRDRLRSGQR